MSTTLQQPETFSFTEENLAEAERIIARYPKGRQQSAVSPLLDIAQRQAGGWLPRAAVLTVAEMLDMAEIRVWEVATFHTMFNLEPIGRTPIRICTTTPCWLRGSEEIVAACEKALGIGLGETTQDGAFTLGEVECLGACVNAPMAWIGDDYYEDLTPEGMAGLIESFREGKPPAAGPQSGRKGSEPASGAKTLKGKD